MKSTYPSGQIIPGAHPKKPNYWKVDCIQQAENAIEKVATLTQEYNFVLVAMYDEMHIDLIRDEHIFEDMKKFLQTGYNIQVLESGKWQKWHGKPFRCIKAIQLSFCSFS